MEEYSKCELIGGGSLRYLDTLSNFLLLLALIHINVWL